jgi:hypothetical protein
MTRVHDETVLTHLLRSTKRLSIRDVVAAGDLHADIPLGRWWRKPPTSQLFL